MTTVSPLILLMATLSCQPCFTLVTTMPTVTPPGDHHSQERARAKELAVRERETQELLRTGQLSSDKKKSKLMYGKVGETTWDTTMGHKPAGAWRNRVFTRGMLA
jgi:hypothetical protein